jgi:hypothetical protein
MDVSSRSFLSSSFANGFVFDSNIWAPNQQVDIIELLGKHYQFSLRLLAIIKTMPPDKSPEVQDKIVGKYKMSHKDDVELATSSIDTPRVASPSQSRQSISQYDVAKEMINYHSIDFGPHCETSGTIWGGTQC